MQSLRANRDYLLMRVSLCERVSRGEMVCVCLFVVLQWVLYIYIYTHTTDVLALIDLLHIHNSVAENNL